MMNIPSETIISHITLYEDAVPHIQDNETHSMNVAKLAALYANEFGMKDFGWIMGLLHDKGKERNAFQHYIRAKNGIEIDGNYSEEHNHAFVGGKLASEHYGKKFVQLLVNQIISHHSGLHNYTDISLSINRDMPTEVKQNIEYIIPKVQCPQPKKEDINHLSRMLFSCLVDADFLDTEAFMEPYSAKLRGYRTSLVSLREKLDRYLEKLHSQAQDTIVNKIRNNVQQRCIEMAHGEQGFYSLTVPTGGGKTLSSVLWALHHAEHHGLKRIIIAIPYTSIIVQTAKILKDILGEENVLEHHSNYDTAEIKDEKQRNRQILATENWDYPIIVTTNVQLFESMFSNKPSTCRKLHNIVKSVIILDEVQTLPTDFLQPIVNSLETYNRLFNVSVLLTTASQPVLSGLIEGCNPSISFKGLDKVSEIIPDGFKLYEKLRRTKIEICHAPKTYDEVSSMLCKYQKVLCIVNTRKDAKELYERLPQKGLTLHLSRMMCPAHIGETIEKIKQALSNNSDEIIRVIATQLVEAGVDIDFPVVFRQESGLDSVLQAAGRCNREGKHDICPTYIFRFPKTLPPGHINDGNNARKDLPECSDWFAPQTMTDYFCRLYYRVTTFDKANIAYYLYKPDEMMFQTAAEKFKLIDDNGYNIIVNWKDSMSLVSQLKENGLSYGLMKKLSQYMVSIRIGDFKKLVSSGTIEEVIDGIYVVTDKSQYDAKIGLRTDNHWMEEILMI